VTDVTESSRADERYAPPYPQAFHSWWPRHFWAGVIIVTSVMAIVVLLSYFFQFPSDPNMPPMPDEGENIPSPEWVILLIYQAYWLISGESEGLRQVVNFWVPGIVIALLMLAPFVIGTRDAEGARMAQKGKFIAMAVVSLVYLIGMVGVFKAGAPAKINGCFSCHNPMMGQRQALPPGDMAKYYRETRKQQVEVGRYRAGKSGGSGEEQLHAGAETYKDANWQMRHMYEPTLTW